MGVPLSAEVSAVKLRGGYYTPPIVAAWLAAWAVPLGSEQVLEPSAGDGQFVDAVARRLTRGGHITAVEVCPSEVSKALSRAPLGLSTVVNSDAFEWWWQTTGKLVGSYDAVVGNPPFIRYQHFPEAHRQAAFVLMRNEGLSPTRLTNAWVPFVVLATAALRPGGRLAMVLPAEVMQVGYASELRSYLANRYQQLTLVTFKRLIFEGILQETVLLLGVRGSGDPATIRTLELEDARSLPQGNSQAGYGSEALLLDHSREKWTQYFLTSRELGLLRECEASKAFRRLGDLGEVDVGVVTGRNEFFVLTGTAAESLGLSDHCCRLVGRAAHVAGVALTDEDWRQLSEGDARVHLLVLGDHPLSQLSRAARAYIAQGEATGMHTGYKCRIRLPHWWKLPKPWAPDAFLLRQIYDGPRIVRNLAGATATDTLHRVKCREGVDADKLAALSVNSLTWAFAEVKGRSYGGGVLELEPREAESLPYPALEAEVSLADVNAIVRHAGTESAMEEVDRLVLKAAGLTKHDLAMLRSIWAKLATRRRSRSW